MVYGSPFVKHTFCETALKLILKPQITQSGYADITFEYNGIAERTGLNFAKISSFHKPRTFYLPDGLGVVVEPDPVHIGIRLIGINENVFADSYSDLAGAVIEKVFRRLRDHAGLIFLIRRPDKYHVVAIAEFPIRKAVLL
jgi:hypothetical protein